MAHDRFMGEHIINHFKNLVEIVKGLNRIYLTM
jgi:hypothetical protein